MGVITALYAMFLASHLPSVAGIPLGSTGVETLDFILRTSQFNIDIKIGSNDDSAPDYNHAELGEPDNEYVTVTLPASIPNATPSPTTISAESGCGRCYGTVISYQAVSQPYRTVVASGEGPYPTVSVSHPECQTCHGVAHFYKPEQPKGGFPESPAWTTTLDGAGPNGPRITLPPLLPLDPVTVVCGTPGFADSFATYYADNKDDEIPKTIMPRQPHAHPVVIYGNPSSQGAIRVCDDCGPQPPYPHSMMHLPPFQPGAQSVVVNVSAGNNNGNDNGNSHVSAGNGVSSSSSNQGIGTSESSSSSSNDGNSFDANLEGANNSLNDTMIGGDTDVSVDGTNNGGNTNGTLTGGDVSVDGTNNGGNTNGTNTGGDVSNNGGDVSSQGGDVSNTGGDVSVDGTNNGGNTNGTNTGGDVSVDGTNNGGNTNGTNTGGNTDGSLSGTNTGGNTDGTNTGGNTDGSLSGTNMGGNTDDTVQGGNTESNGGSSNGGSSNSSGNDASSTSGASNNGTFTDDDHHHPDHHHGHFHRYCTNSTEPPFDFFPCYTFDFDHHPHGERPFGDEGVEEAGSTEET